MNNTTPQFLDAGNYTFTTLLFFIQRAEIFLGHQVAIMFNGDFTGYVINCEAVDEDPIYFFEDIPGLFYFFMGAGNCKN